MRRFAIGIAILGAATIALAQTPVPSMFYRAVFVTNFPAVQEVEGIVEVSNLNAETAPETVVLLDTDVVLDVNVESWESPAFDVDSFSQLSIGVSVTGGPPECFVSWEWFPGGGFITTDAFQGGAITVPVRSARAKISCSIEFTSQVIALHSAAIYMVP